MHADIVIVDADNGIVNAASVIVHAVCGIVNADYDVVKADCVIVNYDIAIVIADIAKVKGCFAPIDLNGTPTRKICQSANLPGRGGSKGSLYH